MVRTLDGNASHHSENVLLAFAIPIHAGSAVPDRLLCQIPDYPISLICRYFFYVGSWDKVLPGISYWPVRWSFGPYPPLGLQACVTTLGSPGLLIWSLLQIFLMSLVEAQLASQYTLGNSWFCLSLCFFCLCFVSLRLRSRIFCIHGIYPPCKLFPLDLGITYWVFSCKFFFFVFFVLICFYLEIKPF